VPSYSFREKEIMDDWPNRKGQDYWGVLHQENTAGHGEIFCFTKIGIIVSKRFKPKKDSHMLTK
jgi:hypothetical protein